MSKDARYVLTTDIVLEYNKPNPIYTNNKITNMASLTKKDKKDKPKSNKFAPKENETALFEKEGITLEILNYDENSTALSVNTNKLIWKALEEFTRHTGKTGPIKHSISFEVEEFANLLGWKIDTPNARKEVTKKIKESCKALDTYNVNWDDSKSGGGGWIRLFSAAYVTRGLITIEFSNSFAKSLRESSLTLMPKEIYGISAKNVNANTMAMKIAQHLTMDNNIKRRSNRTLTVESLLKYANFPSAEDLKKHRHSLDRVTFPFVKCLDVIVKAGVLSDYSIYDGDNPVDWDRITTYTAFKKLKVRFESPLADHAEKDLERRIKEKEESAKKRKAKRRKTNK